MALMVYLSDEVPESVKVLLDVEAASRHISDYTSPYAVRVLSEIEQAKPSADGLGFVDRFGRFLYWSELSTGTKAALLVPCVDACVSVRECGYNAVQAILRYAKSGSISMPYTEHTFLGDCDLVIHGKHFTELSGFVRHLREEVL